GQHAIGNYVVAATEGADDILAPLVLSRWAGVDDRKSGVVGMDFSPLFESGASLDTAGATLSMLLADPSYREHVRARGVAQPVYIGYAEAGRDGGFLAMRVAAYQAQRALHAAAAEGEVPLRLNHARGGNVARGGARLDAIVQAMPPDITDGVLHVTEQGETISQSYGLRSNALRSLGRAFGVLGLATFARRHDLAKPEGAAARQLAAGLAARSRELWRQLCVQDLAFQDFFLAATPIDVIERMQIGSRSIWEAGGTGAMAIRSTPWVFAWSQARVFLPGWYGAGTALTEAIAAQGISLLRETRNDWPFFRLIIDDIE